MGSSAVEGLFYEGGRRGERKGGRGREGEGGREGEEGRKREGGEGGREGEEGRGGSGETACMDTQTEEQGTFWRTEIKLKLLYKLLHLNSNCALTPG